MFERLYTWYGKRVVIAFAAIVVVLIGIGIFFVITGSKAVENEVLTEKATVELKMVRDLGSSNSFTAVGTVQAVSEARLQTEAGGRVTSVTTEIGKKVNAGSVLATIENNAERAALLQAEGAYEAAVAGARSSEVSVDSAKTSLNSAITSGINTYQDAFITIDSILHTDVDVFFTISSDGKALGFKLDGKGKTQQLNNERTALETTFKTWLKNKNTLSESNLAITLNSAYTDALRISQFIETLTVVAQDQDLSTTFRQEDKDAVIATMFDLRESINGVLKQIEGAEVQLSAAKKNYEQAQIAGSQNVPSLASAQVKIALGSLRSAQANYEKTIVRTPITGVVNALYLKAGDYVSPSQQAAIIANNNGLEIVTSINDEDRESIVIGDTVIIEKTASGTITAVGGAIDPTTGKVAVKVSVNDLSTLKNGSTVSIEFSVKKAEVNTVMTVPLSSLKMTGSGPIAFEVTQEQKLKAIPVVLGAVKGENVVITEGLTGDSTIVVDARGLKEGQDVTVLQK